MMLEVMRSQGAADATALQENAENMSGTELHSEAHKIPNFDNENQYINYKAGFICKSAIGNVVKLLQPYDSMVYTQQPEELVAQWGFKWSTDPAHAKPFIASATSPYMKDECCLWNEACYRSLIDNNVHSPEAYPQGWTLVE